MDDSFNKSCLGTDVGVSSRRGGRVLSAGGVAQRTRCRSRLSALDNDARDNPLKSSVCRDGVQVFAASFRGLSSSHGRRARVLSVRGVATESAPLSALSASPPLASSSFLPLPQPCQQCFGVFLVSHNSRRRTRGGGGKRACYIYIYTGEALRAAAAPSLSLCSLSLSTHTSSSQSFASATPSFVRLNIASLSGIVGESITLQTRFSPRCFLK